MEDKYGIAFSLMHVGDLALYQQQYEPAKAAYHESAALFEDLQSHNELAYPLRRLAQIAWHQDDLTRARVLLKKGLLANLVIDQKRGVAANLVGLAVVDSARGERVNAARLLGAVEALLVSIGSSLLPADRVVYESNVETLRIQLGDQVFDDAWAQGRAMTMDQAIAFALEELSDQSSDP